MSDGDSLAWQHINQRCGNRDCIYCRFRDAKARIAELEAENNALIERIAEERGETLPQVRDRRIAELERCGEHRQDIIEILEKRVEELEAVAEAAVRSNANGCVLNDLYDALKAAGYLGGGHGI